MSKPVVMGLLKALPTIFSISWSASVAHSVTHSDHDFHGRALVAHGVAHSVAHGHVINFHGRASVAHGVAHSVAHGIKKGKQL